MDLPRIIITALRGGAGKTILSIGVIAAWASAGKSIAPFKKGPDYIDAGWLALSAGRPCYNLDTYMAEKSLVRRSFLSHLSPGDFAVVEGNRGLFDGIDMEGDTSTAELAKLLETPVILCLDCTKTTRTLAAIVQGCIHFDKDVPIKGVILNRVAGKRHESIVRKNIEHYCGIPVLGAIPKLKEENFPERHMGLVPTAEHSWAKKSVKAVGEIARKYLQLDLLENIAKQAPSVENVFADDRKGNVIAFRGGIPPKVGIVMDSAFQFYYPDNIEALKRQGAEIVYLSPFTDNAIPADLDALYIGGGFPETHSEALANNSSFRKSLKTKAQEGFPIYAECGGLMYLGETLFLKGVSYPMSGIFPVVFKLYNRPQGHGYTHISVDKPNPFYPVGTTLKGHEFHYSKIVEWKGSDESMAFSMLRGTGIHNGKDGLCYKNVLATYTHVHALGTPEWADGVIKRAIAFRKDKKKRGKRL